MATLLDHRLETRTNGKPETLEMLMVNDLMRYTKFRPLNLRLYCELTVRAAIRRNRRTDAKQELVMSDVERAEWEAANPLPE